MIKGNMKHKKDVLLIALALLAALALYLVSQLSTGGAVNTVVAAYDGKEVLRRPLAMNGTYEIKGAEGAVNIICVENGEVYMKEANCRDGLCIRQGRMKNTAKSIVCLPNKVVVRLEGDSAQAIPDDGIDIIIQ